MMETQKKHIEIHIDIDKAADQLNVQIVAEKPTVGEMLTCLLGTVKCVQRLSLKIEARTRRRHYTALLPWF